MRPVILAAALVGGILGPKAAVSQESALAQEPAAADASITAVELHGHVSAIAHDSTLGRDTPSPGLEMTAEYVATVFRAAGLRPLGDPDEYAQRFPLELNRIDAARSGVTVVGGPRWSVGREVQLLYQHHAPPVATGETVVLSGGLGDPAVLDGIDLDDAIVVIVHPERPGEEFLEALGKVLNPVMLGPDPPGVLVVSNRDDATLGALIGNTSIARWEPAWEVHFGTNHGVFEVQAERAAPVFAAHGFDVRLALTNPDRPLTATRLPDLRLEMTAEREKVRSAPAPNVVGLLEGSDPALRDEYVVVVAHMDHLGVGSADAEGDSIYNGADDNATGTAALLELAEALGGLQPAPRRSIVFLATGGEERGLLGSDHFMRHPTVPRERIVGVVNIDMIGRAWRPDTVPAIGMDTSALGEAVARAAERHPELRLVPVGEAPPELNYTGADQINFERRGLPAIFFSTSGPQEYYHQPSDEVGVIDTEFMTRVVRLFFHTVREIADAPPSDSRGR